jgi:DNA-binding response OmpR family regulator
MFDDRLPTVLIVDDERDVRDWLRVSLAMRGWVVSTVATADEALDVAVAEEPDLVIVDFALPGMNGLECARSLRRRGMSGWIILFSAFIDAKRTAAAARLDVQPISKVDQQALFRTVDALQQQLLERVSV